MTKPLFRFAKISLLWLFYSYASQSQAAPFETSIHDLLSRHFTQDQLQRAHTAREVDYLTAKEKAVFQYLNLARMFPREFTSFYISYLRAVEPEGITALKRKDRYYYSLYRELKKASPKEAFTPAKELYHSARKWATESGKKGVIGHKRQFSKNRGSAECCAYSWQDSPMNFVMDLLIDTDIPSLGHRKILLGDYEEIGVAIGPHKGYGHCVVIDLW